MAHLLRRTGFGPHPDHVSKLSVDGYETALDHVLSATPLTVDPPTFGTLDDEAQLVSWWLTQMARPEAGLHEKMVWFWHGHLTSSLDKAEPAALWRQHLVLRRLAMGNARELMQAISIDAAMLGWLDGDGSSSDAPNENYGRELMELFALGRGNYDEADVRSAAYALSGWTVDSEAGAKVVFDAEHGPQRAVTLLGRSVRTAAEAVDAVCDQPAFAVHLTNRIYTYFHGVTPDADVADGLAAQFRAAGLEIAPLVAAVLRHPSFVTHRLTRPRLPVEWYIAANAVLDTKPEPDVLEILGQRPFNPPNVAGWPISTRWLSAGASMARAAYGWERAQDSEARAVDDPAAWVIERASLFEISDDTRDALDKAAARIDTRRERASVLFALAVSCPEFCLA